MKKRQYITLKLYESQNISIIDKVNHTSDNIGIKQTKGEIVAGTYDQKTNEWTNTQLPERFSIAKAEEIYCTILYVTYDPSTIGLDTYIVIQQQANDDVIAITPIITTEDSQLNRLETYFFSV